MKQTSNETAIDPRSAGYFPIRVQALREGTVTHVRVPVYQVRPCVPMSALKPTAHG